MHITSGGSATVSRGYDCLLTVDDDSSKNTTKRSNHHQYASML